MEFFGKLIHTLLHLDPQTVNDFARYLGPWLYVVLFGIVFCETGLVVTPFLPGDTLLFSVGAVAAMSGSPVSLPLTILCLCLAANLGDIINYTFGYRIGPKVFSRESSRLLNKKHLLEAQAFYDRHGRKTIILARFVPILRTFAPFVAGVGKMPFARFIGFSVGGGVLWVSSISMAGYLFGTIPVVANHFKIVVLAIVAISVLPVVIHAWRRKGESTREGFEVVETGSAAADKPVD